MIGVAAGVTSSAAARAAGLGRGLRVAARPVTDLALRPPMLAPRYQPATWLAELAEEGERQRDEVLRRLAALLDAVVPAVATAVAERIDLTALVERYVDIDGLVAGVDLDAAAERLDIDAVARRLDVDAVVDRLDLMRIVEERIDLDALVATVDLDKAAARLDVDAVAERLDLDKVIDRIDLIGLAEEIIAAVDLPEIIRESSASVASDTVRGVRMQSISGDEAVQRAVERIRLRRSRRGPTDAPPAGTLEVDGIPQQSTPGAPREP